MATAKKSISMSSATGRIPTSEAPMAVPMMACSEIGVLRTRARPYLVERPLVPFITPPVGSSMSSPRQKTDGSAAMARSRAWLTAWDMVPTG